MTGVLAPLGGPAAIRIAVQDLYLRLGTDPTLVPHLLDVDRRRLRTHLIELLETAAGVDQMVETLARLGVAPTLVDAIVAGLLPLRDEIIERSAAFAAH